MATKPLPSVALPAVDFFDDIRAGFRHVFLHSEHVTVREDRIAAYADSLPDEAPEDTYDLDHHYIGDAETTAAYVMCVEAVNFGSGFERHLLQEAMPFIDESLYFTVATRLKRHFESNAPLTARDLVAMSAADCARLFHFDTTQPYSRRLNGMFHDSLCELGRYVNDQAGGRFEALVEQAGGSAGRFVGQLAQMKTFNDVCDYKGRSVAFYKRAQLAAAVMSVEFERLGFTIFSDIDQLTMFIDNCLPHVFRQEGILEYTPSLQAVVDSGTEIAPGSAMEIEIRGCAGYAGALIAAHKGIRAMDLDFCIWHASQGAVYKSGLTHRTFSRFY